MHWIFIVSTFVPSCCIFADTAWFKACIACSNRKRHTNIIQNAGFLFIYVVIFMQEIQIISPLSVPAYLHIVMKLHFPSAERTRFQPVAKCFYRFSKSLLPSVPVLTSLVLVCKPFSGAVVYPIFRAKQLVTMFRFFRIYVVNIIDFRHSPTNCTGHQMFN